MKNDRKDGIFGRIALTTAIALALGAMGLSAVGLRRTEALAQVVAAARVVPEPAPPAAEISAAGDDGSDMIGQAESLLVGTPAPRIDSARVAAHR